MNSLLLSVFTAVLFFFHRFLRSHSRPDRLRESFLATWLLDTVFALCGTVVSFTLYSYDLYPWLTFQNLSLTGMYLLLTALLFLLAPSGPSLLLKRRASSGEEILFAEYRFQNALELVRDFFLLLLFLIPLLFALSGHLGHNIPLLLMLKEDTVYGGFCFIAFLVLLPLSLRQSLFWLKNLRGTPSKQELTLLENYGAHLHYRRKNLRI